jgi:hypothetical protein
VVAKAKGESHLKAKHHESRADRALGDRTAIILRYTMSRAVEIWLPTFVSACDGVVRDEQLSHGCNQRDLFGLTGSE